MANFSKKNSKNTTYNTICHLELRCSQVLGFANHSFFSHVTTLATVSIGIIIISSILNKISAEGWSVRSFDDPTSQTAHQPFLLPWLMQHRWPEGYIAEHLAIKL